MTLQSDQFKFTVEDYHKMAEVGIIKDTDRVELINGKIIPMSPIKSLHAGTVDDLVAYFNSKLYGQFSVRGQNPITLDNHSEPEPDIVIAQYRKDAYRSNHPRPNEICVLIEVSDSTLKKDREEKVPLYASASIPEYWIINLVDKQIEIHRQPKNGAYHLTQIISEKGEFSCEGIGLTLGYAQLFPD
ncbi:MAG: Uma2 family endonuclease [Gammaproteobacteria bacterium]|jgi:Uma2 family endonuclease